MLSAVENFGPLVGPAVALTHHHPHASVAVAHHLQAQHQQHAAEQRGYALDIVAAAAAAAAASTDAGVRVSCALSPPATCSSAAAIITTTQTPVAHTQLTQLNALQALKLQQQFQQQYEQHLNHLLNASSAQSSTIGVLPPHRPQPQLGTRADVDIALAHRQQQQQQQQQKQHYHLQHHQQQQQHNVSVDLTRSSNAPPKYMNSLRGASSTAMMPHVEFAPPAKPLKNIEHPTAHENGQTGPMNLVTNTASNAFVSNTNYQLNSTLTNTNSSCSNPASIDNSRPSSSSSSVDVENDESMSPESSSNSTQVGARKLYDSKALLNGAKHQPTYSEASASSAAAAVVAAYQYNYSQLYGGVRPGAGLYNAPVIFAAHNPHASHVVQHPNGVHAGGATLTTNYLGALATHSPTVSPGESSVYSAEYLKALQNAVFQAAPAPLTTPAFHTSPLGNSNTSPISSKSRLRSPASATFAASTQAPMISPTNRGDQRSTATTTTTKLSTGTYLYEKAKRSPPDTLGDSENFFKIPSGKEGSLKHRILTRPVNADKTAVETPKLPVMRAHNSTSSFKKGSYIELANGSLRRVEDMRTEDFIQCAERSPQHQLIESTVVKINTNPSSNTVTIAFSYDRNQSKVDMEVSTDHPFFVYGQGWASHNPELSFKAFGLRCQRLQVGDICISLTKREPPNIHNINHNNNNQNNNNNNNNSNNNKKHSYLHDNAPAAIARTTTTNETQCLERDLQPLILNDSMYATAAAAHMKPATGVCPPNAQYPILHSPHGTIHFMPSNAAHPTYALSESYARFAFPHPQAPQHPPPTQTSPLLHMTRDHTSTVAQSSKSPTTNKARPIDDRQQESTASMSESARKRRWSAPESFSNSDDDGEEESEYQPPLRQKSAPTAAVCSSYKHYLPTNSVTFSNAEVPNATAATVAARNELNCDFLTNYK